MKSILVCGCLFLLYQTPSGTLQLPFGRNYFLDSYYSSTPEEADTGSLNSTEYLTGNGSLQELPREGGTTSEKSSESTTSSIQTLLATQTLLGNESQNSSQLPSSVAQDFNSSETFHITEEEGVARGKPSTTESSTITTPQPQNVYQKAWALVSDTYTLSIVVPVAAGVVFATSILLTIACCRCLRRCCRRRRWRNKGLPDSVKNLRPSDRARLLAAESSDDEF